MAEARPPDARDAAKDIVRDLANLAAQLGSTLGSTKGDAYTWLTDPRYGPLLHRIESAHASVEAAVVEARRRVRLDEGR